MVLLSVVLPMPLEVVLVINGFRQKKTEETSSSFCRKINDGKYF
jgi:hypothetical protein